jgi:hypothetical protein
MIRRYDREFASLAELRRYEHAMGESDEALFAKAREHMEKYSGAASLDRRLWDATVRMVLKHAPEEQDAVRWRTLAQLDPLDFQSACVDATETAEIIESLQADVDEIIGTSK